MCTPAEAPEAVQTAMRPPEGTSAERPQEVCGLLSTGCPRPCTWVLRWLLPKLGDCGIQKRPSVAQDIGTVTLVARSVHKRLQGGFSVDGKVPLLSCGSPRAGAVSWAQLEAPRRTRGAHTHQPHSGWFQVAQGRRTVFRGCRWSGSCPAAGISTSASAPRYRPANPTALSLCCGQRPQEAVSRPVTLVQVLLVEPVLLRHFMIHLRAGVVGLSGNWLETDSRFPSSHSVLMRLPTQHVELRSWTVTQSVNKYAVSTLLLSLVVSEGKIRDGCSQLEHEDSSAEESLLFTSHRQESLSAGV